MNSFEEIIIKHSNAVPVMKPPDARPRLKNIPGIKAVVFDVYGTLFSSSAGDISLVNKDSKDAFLRTVLEENGINVIDSFKAVDLHSLFLQIIESHQAERTKQQVLYPEVDIRMVWNDLLNELLQKELIRMRTVPDIERLAIQFECLVNPVQEMPGLEMCLNAIAENALTMSIISNAQFYTPHLFTAFLGKPMEDLGFCRESSVWSYKLLEGKPSQRLYKIAAQKLREIHSIEPDQVIYVGNDIRNDIWPAGNTGFRTALFAGDSLSLRRRSDDPECAHIEADIEITELSQLLDCLR